MRKFPARFVLEDNGQYSVFFLGKGMEGCLTYGNNMEEAKHNAQEALDGYLCSLYSHREKIPVPQAQAADDIIFFTPSPNIEFAIKLREERERRKINQLEMARRMNIAASQYQRLENPRKANPTFSTIIKIEDALNEKIFLK